MIWYLSIFACSVGRVIPRILAALRSWAELLIWPLIHSVLIDECHYFVNDAIRADILGQELGSHILVSYQPSMLVSEVLASMEVIVTTRNTQREEIDAILQGLNHKVTDTWYEINANLDGTEAALLTPTTGTDGQPRTFRVVSRLTRHVRHHSKYFDVCRHQAYAFV